MSFAPLGFSFDSPWAVAPMHVLDSLTRLYGSLHPAIVVIVIVQTTLNGCRGVETCVSAPSDLNSTIWYKLIYD